jgi:hypothetical protein
MKTNSLSLAIFMAIMFGLGLTACSENSNQVLPSDSSVKHSTAKLGSVTDSMSTNSTASNHNVFLRIGGPNSWILLRQWNGGSVVYDSQGFNGFNQLYNRIQYWKNIYPDLQIFTAGSCWGNTCTTGLPLKSGYFRILNNSSTSPYCGATLQRPMNGVWVSVVSDSDDITDIIERLKVLTTHPDFSSYAGSLSISFSTDFWYLYTGN